MKKAICLTAILIFSFCSMTFAGSGSAIAPYWIKSDDLYYTNLLLTNVSEETVKVFVKIIDSDGNVYTEDSETGDNLSVESNFVGDPLSEQGGTLYAAERGVLRIYAEGAGKGGIILVEWNSSSNNNTALVGIIQRVTIIPNETPECDFIPLNGGNPF